MTLIEQASLGLERVLTQQAMIERDQATGDSLGAKSSRDWQPLATAACFMFPGTGATITRIGGLQVMPEQTVDLETGGMILPAGTDITARDRISQVLDEDGNVIEAGPLEILAVVSFEPLVELSFRRIH